MMKRLYVLGIGVLLSVSFPFCFASIFTNIIKDNPTAVAAELKLKVDPNQFDQKSNSPLMYASAIGSTKIIKLLIKNGAKVNLANKFGCTPLIVAASSGNSDSALLLLKMGADPEHRDSHHNDAIQSAYYWGNSHSAAVIKAYISNHSKGHHAS